MGTLFKGGHFTRGGHYLGKYGILGLRPYCPNIYTVPCSQIGKTRCEPMNEQQLNSTVKWFIGDHYGSKSVIKLHLEHYKVYSNFLKTFCLLIYAI